MSWRNVLLRTRLSNGGRVNRVVLCPLCSFLLPPKSTYAMISVRTSSLTPLMSPAGKDLFLVRSLECSLGL